MKKQFLSLLLVMAGMVSWAQSESGWTDPGNAYHQKTVVYATLNCGNMTYGDINPEVAAFIDGEVRAVTSNYQMNDIGNIYTLKVGGNDADMGKEISFKVYDPVTGLIYPLEVCNEEGVPLETGITYQGDFSYAVFDETTNMYDITLHTLHATPVEVITVEYASEDNPVVPLQVGVETTIEDYVTFNFETASGAEPTMPENPLVWHLDRVDNFGNPTSYYLDIETNSDGFNIATGLNKTNYNVTAGVTIGNGNLGANVDFIVTQPVTSIEVEDAEIYLGVGRFVPQPIFNGGESEPSNTGFTLSVETEDVVRVVGQAIIPQALGTAVVTATSDENPEISTTFQVTVISALESIDKGFDTDVYEYTRWSAGEEIIDLPNPGFNWLTREDGKPVISNTDESYTITSSDPTVIRIDKQETEEGTEILPMSLKKGTAQITYTSNYDPSKSVTFTVIVKQSVQRVAITEVNGEEVVEGGMVDVTVGETIVARAEVTPLDADYEEFTMQFVDANWGIVEKIENYVEILSSEVVDGICTFEFKFIEVPETEYFLQAVIDNDIKSPIVGFNVYNVIESIDVYMNEEYWITEDENIFEFKYNVNPGNVLDPSLTVESSNTDVAEVLMSEDAGMYRIHAYSTGEVTFTFTSNANSEVSTQVTTVIKREPTGVAITKVGSIEIPAPGTTPAETVVEVAVGQDVVAVAGIEPNDATYDSFEFRLVNDDDIPYEADVVTIGDRIDNGDGTISIGFTFNSVPDRDVYLKAVVRYNQYDNETSLQHRIRIDVRKGVTDVAVFEEVKTIWFTEGMEEFFTIQATVYPDDATNKELEVSIDGEGVVELVGESEDVENGYRFVVLGKGTAIITFTSVDNPSVTATCEVTAKKRVQELMAEGNLNLFNDGENGSLWFGFYPEDADFDPEMLIVNVDSPGMPEDWTALDLFVLDEGENYINYEVVPRALGYGSIEFSYCNPEDEEAMSYFAEYSVQEKTTVEEGWNWFSLINGEVNIAETLYDMLIEARSQNELVFNDASWGLFGDLINMDNTQAYKLNIHYSFAEIYLYTEANVEGKIDTKSLKKGWNWVSYPYEFGYDVATIFDASMFSENDMILSKNDGFVQRNADGVWEGGLSELVPYQGYMVYCNADIELPMLGRYDLPQGYFVNLDIPRAASRERATWVYDNSRFANSMAIVAKVDVENCEDYTIGAFVGDECRGEGKFINGKAFISVGGESGENISFRLLNKWTGELLDVAQEIPFGDMAGSISAPVLMGTIDGTTGIVDINTIDSNNVEAIYDITGRKVEQMTEGIYVIKVREGDKIVTKKVRK